MITKNEIENKIVKKLMDHPNEIGNLDHLFVELLEDEKLCPWDIEQILKEMTNQNFELPDGRKIIHGAPRDLKLNETYIRRVYGHKYLHTGELNCANKMRQP